MTPGELRAKPPQIFDKYGVNSAIRKQVMDFYALNQETEENWKELCKHDDYRVRELVALNVKYLNILANDFNYGVRYLARINLRLNSDLSTTLS